jgi:hypothetical protein
MLSSKSVLGAHNLKVLGKSSNKKMIDFMDMEQE